MHIFASQVIYQKLYKSVEGDIVFGSKSFILLLGKVVVSIIFTRVSKRSQQGLLATYLIPGCIGRGVELGLESLSGCGDGGSI